MDYIKHRLFNIACLVIITAIFAFQFYLENIPPDSIVYGFSVSFFFILIITLLDFSNYKKEIAKLKTALTNLDLIQSENLSAFNEKDKLTKEIILTQSEIIKAKTSDIDVQKSEQIDFYTQWVHQIKTPIFALKLLLKDSNSSDVRAEIAKIENYTEMVLNYVKLGESTTELDLSTLNIKTVLNNVIKSYSSVFISKKLQLICDIEETNIVTDEKWLTFALSQIISNAVKYTEKGSVNITLKNNILTISDTGIGINASDLPRIFEKGFTGSLGRKNLNSTGLGLYLTKKSLDLLGIRINATSKINSGTSFTLTLPKKQIF